MDWIRVADRIEVAEGRGLQVEVDGREIAIFRVREAYFWLDNVCPHRGGPIAEGVLDQDTVTCPWHDWTFSLETGLCTFNPKAGLECFEVRADGDDILVRISG